MREPARSSTLIALALAALLPATACTSNPGADAAIDARDINDVTLPDAVDALPDEALPDVQDVVVDTGPPTYSQVQTVFDHSCAIATTQCHAAGATTNSLRLDVTHALAETVGIASTQVPRLMRIAAGDPANSYLFLKLLHRTLDPLPECVPDAGRSTCSAMPAPPASPLGAAQIELIRRWIEVGATP